jgi:hypothetical protein
MADFDLSRIAVYDKERKGIFIPSRQLRDSPFAPGDRFSVYPKPTQLFAVTIKRDDNGGILFDKNGIFLQRTRRIDILMGGIFNEYVIDFEPDEPGTIKLRPLEVVLETSRK